MHRALHTSSSGLPGDEEVTSRVAEEGVHVGLDVLEPVFVAV
jgi:hypothetical protein